MARDHLGGVVDREPRAARSLANGLERSGLEEEKARFVARDEDRAQVPDRSSLAGYRLGGAARLIGAALHGAVIGLRDVHLDEKLGHGTTVGRAVPWGNRGDPWGLRPEARCELPPGADPELRVGVPEVELDRVHGDDEPRRDLLVREALGG